MPKPLTALVTCGGTREPVDDVRVLTNLSRGRFGATIVRALLARGVHVTVLGSREALALLEDTRGPLTRVPFGSFADLQAALAEHTDPAPDLLFMAAAVSDYTPVKAAGKIRSDAEQLTITLEKTPKLLGTLRERCGVETFLVGFKLLSGVSRDELVAVARRQVLGGRLNLTVANDLQTFTEVEHPVVLVTPEGGAVPVGGRRERVAEELVDFVLQRHAVTWSRSTADGEQVERDDRHAEAGALLAWAQDAGLLTHASDGNVTCRAVDGGFWATPRGVDKAALGADDLVRVHTEPGAVRYRGERKPSIDSAVHGWLYDHLPELQALVHFHGGAVLADARTAFPWPCGTVEAAGAIHAALGRAAAQGRWRAGAFAIELVQHGWLLGLGPGGPDRIAGEWSAARRAYDAHLASLGAVEAPTRLEPVLRGAKVVGVVARWEGDGPRSSSLYLLSKTRGQGLGVRLAQLLDEQGERVRVHEGCGVLAFYLDRGWRPVEAQGAVTVLEPPSRRGDLVEAASVCLFDAARGRVLLGQRKRGSHAGRWSFPGGRREEGESALACAVRELEEETGIDLPLEPAREEVVTVGAPDGSRAFRVRCFVAAVPPGLAAHPSDELEARWIELPTAMGLELAPGVRAVLRGLVAGLR